MRKRIRRYILFLMLCLIAVGLTACNKTAETSDKGTPTPSVTTTPTPFPLTTLPPTPTPVPARETVVDSGRYDEYRVFDCENYYFEVLSFKEQSEGGYAIETVFENRQDIAVALSIFNAHINFLKPMPREGSVDWEEKIIEPGEKKTIEFWISDAYAKRLKISDVSDFYCVRFEYLVEAVDDMNHNNYDMFELLFYNCDREQVKPYEHVLTDNDIVLVDRDDVKLYLTDFVYAEDGDCYVYFYWGNNSKGCLYRRFNCESVNGYECKKDLFYDEEAELDFGMGGYDFFIIRTSEIEKSGNTSVTEFDFEVTLYYDAGIWCWEELIKENFTVYPSERRAVQKEKPLRKNNELFDTKYYKLVYNGFLTEKRKNGDTEYTDYYIHVYFENKSAQTLQLLIPDAKLNGIDYTNELNYRTVSPGEGASIKFRWTDTGEALSEFSVLKALELNILIKNLDDEAQGIVSETRFGVSP